MGLKFWERPRKPVVVVTKAKRGRPTKEVAAEKRKQRLADLKAQVTEKQLQQQLREMDEGDGKLRLSLDDLAPLNKKLAALGLEIVSKRDGRPLDGATSVLNFAKGFFDEDSGRMLAQGLGQMLLAGRGGAAAATVARPPSQAAGTAPIAAAATPEALPPASAPAPFGLPASAPAGQPSEVLADDAQLVAAGAPGLGVTMSLRTRGAILQLAGRTPEQGAGWLLAQAEGNVDVQSLVVQLCGTPDEQLGELLAAIAAQAAEVAPLMEWLAPQEAWLRATVAALRVHVSIAPEEMAAPELLGTGGEVAEHSEPAAQLG